MQLFSCANCGQVLYFENTRCERCGHDVGLAEAGRGMLAFSALYEGSGKVFISAEGGAFRYCANHAFDVCNWLVPVEEGDGTMPEKGSSAGLRMKGGNGFCRACALNRTIPDLQEPVYREYWTRIEVAKHQLVYSLLRLGLPLVNRFQSPDKGLSFDFVADERDKKVFTGHNNGLVTINIAEADDIQREMTRQNMNEPYRTLLGHFRHEVGHYYWDVLIREGGRLEEYRQVFGDDGMDYGHALQRHYQEGPPVQWTENYISAYASAHPWEDWAETWAHYLHIMDTFETAYAYDLRVQPRVAPTGVMAVVATFDPYMEPRFDTIIRNWLPMTFAMNSLNHSMGIGNLYPFVIPPTVMKKLSFIHAVCQAVRGVR